MTVWVLVGDEDNWRTTFRYGNIWGVKERWKSTWEQPGPDDPVVFYCKYPIAGVTGIGTVAKTFRQDTPFWPDEERAGRVIYPSRFEININYLLPESDWRSKAIRGSTADLGRGRVARGLNVLRDSDVIARIDSAARDNFGVSISGSLKKPGPIRRTSKAIHKRVQDMLVEIGSLQRYLSHREYPMDSQRLDVVWRRVEGSVPTYVFEVQVGGDIYHALGKLKHAHDIWNSTIMLVLGPADMPRAESLLARTFHEVKEKVRLVKVSKIKELYQLKKRWKDFERSLGIF